MLRNLLVGVDGSDCGWVAWEYGVSLASLLSARLRALSVVDVRIAEQPMFWNIGGSLAAHVDGETQQTLTSLLRDHAESVLQKAAAAAAATGVPCETQVAYGLPSLVISQESALADLVIISHRGQSAEWPSVMLGSTAEAVVRSSSAPVLVCPSAHRTMRRILAAYDGSDHASHALHLAAELATSLEAQLEVLVVHRQPPMAEEILADAMRYLDAYPVSKAGHAVTGHPAEIIAATAEEQKADLIAMGAYGHSRVRETIIGSTTEEVMRKAMVPLLLAK